MKKNLITVIILSLVLVISLNGFASADDVKQNIIQKNISTLDETAGVPTWNLGDNWTYNGYLRQDFGPLDLFNLKLSLEDLTFTVENNVGESYQLSFEGFIKLGIGVGEGLITISYGDIFGDLEVDKTEIGIMDFNIDFDGFGKLFLFKLPIGLILDTSCDKPLSPFEFPFTVGDSWNSTAIDFFYEITINLFGGTKTNSNMISLPQAPLYCELKESVDVEAGTFQAYKINLLDIVDIYYNVDVGNIIKIKTNDQFETTILSIELSDTNII